jgi:hypothetical protein
MSDQEKNEYLKLKEAKEKQKARATAYRNSEKGQVALKKYLAKKQNHIAELTRFYKKWFGKTVKAQTLID